MSDKIESTKKQGETASTHTDTSSGSASWGEVEINQSDSESKEDTTGHLAETKELYAKEDKAGKISWSDKHPYGVEKAIENADTLKYAVIVQKKKPKAADPRKPLVIDSLVIQSPYLKRVLSDVLADYPGIVTDMSRLKLNAPLECIVHRWDRFAAAKDDPLVDKTTKEHLELFHKILQEDLGDIIQLRGDYLATKTITFEHLWSIFVPGSTVLTTQRGKLVGAKFNNGYYHELPCGPVYRLNCDIIDWDGVRMGWTNASRQIPAFLGAVPVSTLPCFPLALHAQPDVASGVLRERGRKFEKLTGYCYKAYKGTALWHPDHEKTFKEHVHSRVVIDGENWEKKNGGFVVEIQDLQDETETINRDFTTSVKPKYRPLTDYQLLLTSAMTRGYSLKNKRWMEFFIDDVMDIDFDTAAFDSLVLPQEKKDLILAFAESQVKFKDSFDDVISGKGKGIIMLLSGGPGIGKTLTAESVAEEMRAPLYIMSAGDLGVQADEVDTNLTEILTMVASWNAVLLLDECDVFLEERSAHDIERNRIVSIFLRTLEYYEGILFLTTNRIKQIDPAFQSRIHLSLEYESLDAAARTTMWKTFVDRAVNMGPKVQGSKAHDVAAEEIEALGQLDMNGRQIKNVVKTANLLACHKMEKLSSKHLRTVLQVQGHSL